MNAYYMLAISVGIGIVGSFLAAQRGKNPYLWFCVGLLFGVLGLFAIFIPLKKKEIQNSDKRSGKTSLSYIEGPSGCFWYYLEGAEQRGPMSLVALTQAWEKGEIAPSTYVWNEDLPEWKVLQELIRAPKEKHTERA